jgi:hypothetical protein
VKKQIQRSKDFSELTTRFHQWEYRYVFSANSLWRPEVLCTKEVQGISMCLMKTSKSQVRSLFAVETSYELCDRCLFDKLFCAICPLLQDLGEEAKPHGHTKCCAVGGGGGVREGYLIYSRSTSTEFPSFFMIIFIASLTNLTALLPLSHISYLRKQTHTGTSAALLTETHWCTRTWLHPLSRLLTTA